MNKIQMIEQLLTDFGFPVRRNTQSLVTTCLLCNKPKHLYIYLSNGFGKCMRCNATYSPESIVSIIKNCSYAEAKKILFDLEYIPKAENRKTIPKLFDKNSNKPADSPAVNITLPMNFFKLSERYDFKEAWQYLKDRGIEKDIIEKYDLRYSPEMQRVIIPVYNQENACIGWQGRDITGESELPYLSPIGFNRAKLLLGYEKISDKFDYLILSEGPFDFLKLAILRNTVCSFGKNVTERQLGLIQELTYIKKVYIALDPDACDLFDRIAHNLEPNQQVYLMLPPDNKKDFGECTTDEILKSFLNAKKYSRGCFLYSKIIKE